MTRYYTSLTSSRFARRVNSLVNSWYSARVVATRVSTTACACITDEVYYFLHGLKFLEWIRNGIRVGSIDKPSVVRNVC